MRRIVFLRTFPVWFFCILVACLGCRKPEASAEPAPRPATSSNPTSTIERTQDVPVVRQKDRMDCGVAVLQAMLQGYRISSDYDTLRKQLKTDDTGTSIDLIEEEAPKYGLSAYQTVVPLEHVFLENAKLLPSIIVVKAAARDNHFLLLWNLKDNHIESMDPAKGTLSLSYEELQARLLFHRQEIPDEALRDFLCGETFLLPLSTRIQQLGLTQKQAEQLEQEACSQPGWVGLAALDATTRKLATQGRSDVKINELETSKEHKQGPNAQLPEEFWFLYPLPKPTGPQAVIQGAVLLVAEGRLP